MPVVHEHFGHGVDEYGVIVEPIEGMPEIVFVMVLASGQEGIDHCQFRTDKGAIPSIPFIRGDLVKKRIKDLKEALSACEQELARSREE